MKLTKELTLRDYQKVHGREVSIDYVVGGHSSPEATWFTLGASSRSLFSRASLRLHVVKGEGPAASIKDGYNIRPGYDSVAGTVRLEINGGVYKGPLSELAYFHIDSTEGVRGFIAIHPVRMSDSIEHNLAFYLRLDRPQARENFHRAQDLAGFRADGFRYCAIREND